MEESVLREWNGFSKVTQASKDQSSLPPKAELFSADCRDHVFQRLFAPAYGLLSTSGTAAVFFRKAGGACRDFPSEEVSLVPQSGKSFSFRPHFGDWAVVCVQSLMLPCANKPFLWPVNSAGLPILWLFPKTVFCASPLSSATLSPHPQRTLQSPFQMHDPFLHLLTHTQSCLNHDSDTNNQQLHRA